MDSENTSLINRLTREWPVGTIAVTPWLKEHGVYQQLANRYVKTGWLERIGYGAYARAGDHPTWLGGLYSLQFCLKLPIHVGGRTALELEGYGQNIARGRGRRVFLWAAPRTRLPAWYRKHEWGVRVEYLAMALFGDQTTLGLADHYEGAPREASDGPREPAFSGYSVTLSSPERGMLETCHLVPAKQSFEEAQRLMEGLATMRPSLAQTLLEACTSVKAKRVFLYLADRVGHRWLDSIDTARIDLGRGKRMLVRGGRFDSRYQITVPGDRR